MAPRSSTRPPTLFVIGGAEDRVGRASLLRRFVRLAGGRQSRIVLVPTASSFPDEMARAYDEVFQRLGAPAIRVVDPQSRAEAGEPALIEAVDDATGVFLGGGSQVRLSQYLLGTSLADAIHRAHTRGAVIGGTSAGASAMSELMISLGHEGLTPRQQTSQISHGLGLIKGAVIDQHFGQRTRYGRLMSVVAVSPDLLGIGIDEDTAIEVTGDERFAVHGSGGVFVVDCAAAVTDAHDARRGAPLLVSGATIHQLPAGSVFSLRDRRLESFTERHPYTEVSREPAKP